MQPLLLVLDVGTTGVKAFVFDAKLKQHAKAYAAYPIHAPKKGWVEQDPKAIVHASIHVIRQAVKQSHVPLSRIASMGITNQRETTIVWDTKNGKPIYPAIVWEDVRTMAACASLKRRSGKAVRLLSGLTLDPYFSASKIAWILDNIPHARTLADCGRLRFGTVDTWLMANLCENAPHYTDTTNASRTMLMDIRTGAWSQDLLSIFNIPPSVLPEIHPSAYNFGVLKKDVLGRSIPLTAVCGDQQSSHYAATMLSRGRGPVTKVTYGTGVFVSQSLGKKIVLVDDFFTTVIPSKTGIEYALEAKVCVSGPDVMKRIKHPQELKRYFYTLAKRVNTYLTHLPKTPSKIIIDGGSSRDGLILLIQEEVSGIPTEPLMSYDGTALGTALLQIGACLPVR
ncbi:MAG: FGGY family carbohydrate kinase [Patescibacteria group bacterium]